MKNKKGHKNVVNKPKSIFLKYSFTGGIGILAFYIVTLYLVTKDINHPIQQFKLMNPWISLLVLGFSLQTGIFFLMKKGYMFSLNENGTKRTAGASMAVSSASMVACCAHHLADVVPFMGASVAAVFFADYQKEFLIIGVVFNLIGLLYMSWIITGKARPKLIFNYLVKNIT